MKLFNTETSKLTKSIHELSAAELLAISGGDGTTVCSGSETKVVDKKTGVITVTKEKTCTTYPTP